MPIPLAAAALPAAVSGTSFLLSQLLSLGSGILSGILGLGESPSEEAFGKLFDELYDSMDWLKETPFSKEELFQSILPAVQQTFRGGASVAAGAIGSTIPESAGGTPQGQAFMDYYVQALAPTIAKGEELAGQAHIGFVDLWAKMDTGAKQRFLQAIQVGGNLAGGLSGMTEGQQFFTNFLQGADIASTVQGNLALGDSFNKKATDINSLLGDMFKTESAGGDITSTIGEFLKPRSATPNASLGG